MDLFYALGNWGFSFCCQLVDWTAKIFGCTYFEMNTYLFIILQPLIYVLLSLVILCYTRKAVSRKIMTPWALCLALGYALFNLFCFCLIQFHYRMDADTAARLCIKEMYQIQDLYGIPYGLTNLILFILAFLAIVLTDLLIIFYLRHRIRSRSGRPEHYRQW